MSAVLAARQMAETAEFARSTATQPTTPAAAVASAAMVDRWGSTPSPAAAAEVPSSAKMEAVTGPVRVAVRLADEDEMLMARISHNRV
jgi:hypothetical protein